MVIHTREEVIERTIREFEALEQVVARLSEEEWNRPVPRPETKDAWTVKDALAHMTHWKADVARRARRDPQPEEERGLNITDGNELVYKRWKDRPAQEVLEWHRQVQEETLAALGAAPEGWFSREHSEDWPYDLDGHLRWHRVRDIERGVQSTP